MLYPAGMKKVLIGVHHTRFPAFLSSLHEAGIMEIIDIRETAGQTGLSGYHPAEPDIIPRVIKTQLLIEQYRELCQTFSRRDESIITTWFTPPQETRIRGCSGDAADICTRAESIAAEASEIRTVYDELLSIREKIHGRSSDKEMLASLLPLDLNPADLTSTRFTDTVAGLVATEDLATITGVVTAAIPSGLYIESVPAGDRVLVVIITLAEYRSALMESIKNPLFRRIIPPANMDGRPADLIASLQDEITRLSAYEQDLTTRLTSLAGMWRPKFEAIHEELSLVRERLETARRSGQTRDVTFIEGWVPEKETNRLGTILEKTSGNEGFWVSEESGESGSVPVMYDNPSWLKPFEFLTTMFALPRHDEIDPTLFVAPAFLFFFGLMLGDAGYGVIIFLVAWLLYRGAGQRDGAMRDMCIVLMGCGIADIILGTVQGGWFGDLLPRFFGITPPFVLIDPIRSPIQFFQIALIIGTIHINLGIFLGFWQKAKRKQYRDAYVEHANWFVIQPAAAVLLVQFFGWITFPSPVLLIAGALFVCSCGVLFVRNGPMGFFSLTGFLGDWLSYVRILALALATGGIAMTINLLAEMIASIHPVMIIPAILFLIAGQTFNLVIQALGSVIHALRLHYIEFFGKFYTGGGRPFNPFTAKRVFTITDQDEGG